MVTTVYGLTNDYESVYTLSPKDAVIAAFALHAMGNANSWEWCSRYSHLLVYGTCTVSCGDFVARLQL